MNKNDIINDFIIREGIIADYKCLSESVEYTRAVEISAEYFYRACIQECGRFVSLHCVINNIKRVIYTLENVRETGCEKHSGNQYYKIRPLSKDECKRFTTHIIQVLQQIVEYLKKNKRNFTNNAKSIPDDISNIIDIKGIIQ